MPSFVTSTVILLSDVFKWIAAVDVVGMTALVGYHAMMRYFSQEEMDAVRHSKGIKNVLTYGTLVLIASVIVSTVTGYYK